MVPLRLFHGPAPFVETQKSAISLTALDQNQNPKSAAMQCAKDSSW